MWQQMQCNHNFAFRKPPSLHTFAAIYQSGIVYEHGGVGLRPDPAVEYRCFDVSLTESPKLLVFASEIPTWVVLDRPSVSNLNVLAQLILR
jgi:hypothetical protein